MFAMSKSQLFTVDYMDWEDFSQAILNGSTALDTIVGNFDLVLMPDISADIR